MILPRFYVLDLLWNWGNAAVKDPRSSAVHNDYAGKRPLILKRNFSKPILVRGEMFICFFATLSGFPYRFLALSLDIILSEWTRFCSAKRRKCRFGMAIWRGAWSSIALSYGFLLHQDRSVDQLLCFVTEVDVLSLFSFLSLDICLNISDHP